MMELCCHIVFPVCIVGVSWISFSACCIKCMLSWCARVNPRAVSGN